MIGGLLDQYAWLFVSFVFVVAVCLYALLNKVLGSSEEEEEE